MSAVPKISRVLVGVDFDEASGAALKMAGVLASAWHAEITVFHSAMEEAPAYFTSAQLEALEAEREQSRARISDQLRAFAERYVSGAIAVVAEDASPHDAILRMAGSFDLIVVGTHRRHGAQRWWLGSVAEAVVRRSPCPVLVVPTGAIVSETRRPLTILASGGQVAEVDAWVELLTSTFRGDVVRSPDIHHCAPDRFQNADLIVLAVSTDSHAQEELGAIVQVLKKCVRPVLFVPSVGARYERSSS